MNLAGEADESILKLAVAMHSNPGVYALLLGSGVSRGAGIPTGWEIVTDLITKVAAADGVAGPTDPEAWFKGRFGKPASYTKVVELLAGTPTERRGLLRKYFEPTEEEQEQGLKTPTQAHRAIASLVEAGYVRVILTTNFDRLIETALADKGIAADVVSSNDDLRGAIPLIHSDCRVVKVHGDYLDARIRNTEKELAKYPKRLEEFLDGVFDEFGLVVCGWSGEWDTALSAAIVRCPTRRFTTYWMARGALGEEAKNLIEKRRAEVVAIDDADGGFSELGEKIEALRALDRPHPLSVDVAVATVKRFLSDTRFRIPLHDLVVEETGTVRTELDSERFSPHGGSVTKEVFQQRMQEYEAVVEKLAAIAAAVGYYDEGANSDLLRSTMERLSDFSEGSGLIALLSFRRYPALLVSYTGGISAIAGDRFRNLSAILREPTFRDESQGVTRPVVDVVNVATVFTDGTGKWVPREQAKQEYTAASNYLLDAIRPTLQGYIPDDGKYEDMFDTFEYLLALTHYDVNFEEDKEPSWTPVGRYGWRLRHRDGNSPWREYFKRGIARGTEWGLLKAGFFGGSPERLGQVVEKYDLWLREATRGWS